LEHSITTIRSRLRKTSPARYVLCCIVAAAAWQPALAADRSEKYLQVFVTEPYLDLRTGPGRGYPVFQAVERDASVDVIKRKTDWVKVRTERGVEGWASVNDMTKTRLADGSRFTLQLGDLAGFASHKFELGIVTGDYGGATLTGGHFAMSLNDNLKVDVALSEFLGNATNGYKVDVGLNHVFFPQWRISPFVQLGGGWVRLEPKATLVTPIDRQDEIAYAGAGVRVYLARRFFLRGEYRWNTVFTSRDDNEEVREWKVGLAAFF
jgi:uncharacterized protein YgiM (DUF1202 family)